MMINGKSTNSSMIQDGTYAYFWSGTQGTKMKIDTIASASPAATNQQTASLDQKVNTQCASWSVDASMFTSPANVTFTDLNSMMQKQPGSSSAPNMSSYCAQITDPQSKAACEAASGQ